MTRVLTFFSIAAALFGQTTETKPAFELADVHVSPPARNPYLRGPMVLHGLYELRFATMVDLIRTAYGVEAERVVGGPNWLEYDTFDLIAKLPEGIRRSPPNLC